MPAISCMDAGCALVSVGASVGTTHSATDQIAGTPADQGKHVGEISASCVRERLSYNPETGSFTWKAHATMPPWWNGKYANQPAGSADNKGYIKITILRRSYRAHRLAWLTVHGAWPTNEIDHVNGINSDNRIANLRQATTAENNRNQGVRKDNQLGTKGVRRHGSGYQAKCQNASGVCVSLGVYPTLAAAKAARDEFAAREHKEFFRP